MQDIDKDLRQALKDTLSGNAATRKACIDKVFSKKAVFSHIAFIADNIDDIWGVYELWACNNVSLDIDVWQIVANPEGTEVMVNSIEHCWLWWNPPFALLGGPKVFLHTVFQLEDTPQGKKITKQVDHTMWVESLLFHNLPPFVDEFFKDFYRPVVGRLWSTAGNWVHDLLISVHTPSSKVDIGHPIGKRSMHPERFREDLARAIQLGFCGSFQERRELALTMYTNDAEFWHPFAHVKGNQNIAGYFQFWCTLHRKIDVNIFGFIPSESGNEVMIDLEQNLTPFFWPPYFPPLTIWLHVILYLKNSPDGGKLIYKHEDHALWVESLVFGNPVGQWYKDWLRPVNGTLMGILGRFIWQLMNWWLSNQPEQEYQAKMRSNGKKQK